MKVKNPILKTLAIIDTENILLGTVYIWVDSQLQKVKNIFPIPIQDRYEIQCLLQENSLPYRYQKNYIQICINLLKHWHKQGKFHHDIFKNKKEDLSYGYHTMATLETIDLVLQKNMFVFGYTYWLQKWEHKWGEISGVVWNVFDGT